VVGVLGALDLQRAVLETEAFAQDDRGAVEHPVLAAVGGGAALVGDHEVGRDGGAAVVDRPDVQVVDLRDALDVEQRGVHVVDVDAGGRALEQDVPGLAQEGHGAGQEDRDDHERSERVGVGPPGGQGDHGGGEHGHRAQRVAEHVQRGAADVHPAAAALQDRERDDVADETDEAVDQQRAAGHLGGAGEALDRLDRDPHRDPEQQHRVQRGAQHLGAAEPEGPAAARRAGGERGGGEGGAEGDDVGADVPEVGEQRQRPREDRADGADDEHQRGDAERDAEPPPVVGTGAVSVTMSVPHGADHTCTHTHTDAAAPYATRPGNGGRRRP
jgi:hypothetical protein